MIDYQHYKPARALTLKGRMLIGIVRLAYWLRKLGGGKQWRNVVENHHEDPLKMTFSEKVYLGYKYYYKALIRAEAGSHTDKHFGGQQLKLTLPEHFIAEKTITLSAGGDLIPYDAITPENCEQLWDETGDFFFKNDIVFANLETVADISRPYSAAPEVMLHDMFFNIHEESFHIFSGNGKYKGYDVLSSANNHTMDLGVDGILATQSFLKKKNIAYAGTADSENNLHNFPIIERSGIKIAFIAFTYSLNKETLPGDQPWLCNHLFLNEAGVDLSLIKQQAEIAKERGADFIVASLHMGCAYQAYPSGHTMENMHRICNEADIDLLIGGHPHNPQPFEIYTNQHTGKQHFIVYSLGDFIAYDIFKWCHLPLMIKFHITQGSLDGARQTVLTKVELKPCYMYRDKAGRLYLKDFLQLLESDELKQMPFATKKEVAELKDFFSRFIITENQRHILAT